MSELKPCYGCGKSNVSAVNLYKDCWYVECRTRLSDEGPVYNCGVQGPKRETKAEAAKAWNTRSPKTEAVVEAAKGVEAIRPTFSKLHSQEADDFSTENIKRWGEIMRALTNVSKALAALTAESDEA